MLKNTLAIVLFSLITVTARAQPRVTIAPAVRAILGKDSSALLVALDSQLAQKDYDSIAPLTLELINYYPLDKNQYWLSISCSQETELYAILSFIAVKEKSRYTFQVPLGYLTRHWQTKHIGRITYHYADTIDVRRARAFEKRNETIAKMLGLKPDSLGIYLTDNLQDIMPLLGYTYDVTTVGRTRSGYMVSTDTIFAILHNEDFSHDLIHYYVAKVRTNVRNGVAEEGLAYYWGDAYYPDSSGNSIDYAAQLKALKQYLREHPDSSLLSLFQNSPKPFSNLAPEMSIRSVISARLFQAVDQARGIDGIKALINCGRGDDNYFRTLDSLTGIDRANFDTRLRALLNL
jgi:hypothetical protein